MPAFGGFSPGAERYGGAKPVLRVILDSLNAARGTAYDVSTSSNVYVENMAIARVIADIYGTNERLGNQSDPWRTCLLERWETICGLATKRGDTEYARRRRLAKHLGRTGTVPAYQTVHDLISDLVSPITFTINHLAPGDTGVIEHWPAAWYVASSGTTPPTVTLTGVPEGNYEFILDIAVGGTLGVATFTWSSDGGDNTSSAVATAADVALGATGITAHFPAGTYATDNQYTSDIIIGGWHSTVAYVAIAFTKPTWMSEGEYVRKISEVRPILDGYLPAWILFDIAREGSVAGEFHLDEDMNLDNQRMSVS